MNKTQSSVYAAIEKIGNQSKLDRLSKVSTLIAGYHVSRNSACHYRKAWEKERGTRNDCRKYSGQPDRDMTVGLPARAKGNPDFDFVTAFMSATDYEDLAKHLGWTVRRCQNHASFLRSKKVKLPYMRRRINVVRELNRLIESLRKAA